MMTNPFEYNLGSILLEEDESAQPEIKPEPKETQLVSLQNHPELVKPGVTVFWQGDHFLPKGVKGVIVRLGVNHFTGQNECYILWEDQSWRIGSDDVEARHVQGQSWHTIYTALGDSLCIE